MPLISKKVDAILGFAPPLCLTRDEADIVVKTTAAANLEEEDIAALAAYFSARDKQSAVARP